MKTQTQLFFNLRIMDVDEWLFSKRLNPLEEIKRDDNGDRMFLADLLELYMEEQLAFIALSLIDR